MPAATTSAFTVSPEHAALMFPDLNAEHLARIAAHGSMRSFRKGEVLIEAGDQHAPFFVVKAGAIEVLRVTETAETLIVQHGPGSFTGEANLLLGRPALMRGRAAEDGEAVELT